jgi:putative transposase
MEHGFEYLKMAVDFYGRRILAHRLAITPEAVHAKDIVQKAFKCNGRTEIIILIRVAYSSLGVR